MSGDDVVCRVRRSQILTKDGDKDQGLHLGQETCPAPRGRLLPNGPWGPGPLTPRAGALPVPALLARAPGSPVLTPRALTPPQGQGPARWGRITDTCRGAEASGIPRPRRLRAPLVLGGGHDWARHSWAGRLTCTLRAGRLCSETPSSCPPPLPC